MAFDVSIHAVGIAWITKIVISSLEAVLMDVFLDISEQIVPKVISAIFFYFSIAFYDAFIAGHLTHVPISYNLRRICLFDCFIKHMQMVMVMILVD